MKPRELK